MDAADQERAVRLSQLVAPCYGPLYQAMRQQACDEMWLSGGRGSGKSSFCSLAIAMGLLRDREANAIIYRKVAETLRDSVYAQMLWALEALGVAHLWHGSLSPLELRYRPTGQRVLFRGMDKPEKSKGVKLRRGYFRYLWLEELTEFGGMEEIRTVKASVLRSGGGSRPLTLYTYNPPISAHHWVNGEALRPWPGRMTHHSDYRDMPPAWLGEAFLAEARALEAANPRAYKHMYLGQVTGTGAQVFENLSLRPIRPEEWQGLPTYSGHDFGFATDPDVYVRCAFDRKRRVLFIVGELARRGMSLQQLAQELARRCGRDVITADSADPRGIAELRMRGLTVLGARKGPGSIDRGMKWLQTLAQIVIDPSACPFAAGEFARYEYQRGQSGELLPRYPDRGNHAIDAVRYAMEGVSGRRMAVAVR